jgi:hypothetical protein
VPLAKPLRVRIREFQEQMMDYLKASMNLRRLCGNAPLALRTWESVSDIPYEATFSRAFGQFSRERLPGKVHEAMVRKNLEGRIVGHNSRDSTKIEGREKATKKSKKEAKQKKPRGGGKKGIIQSSGLHAWIYR